MVYSGSFENTQWSKAKQMQLMLSFNLQIKKALQVSWIRKSDSAILSVDDMLVCIISFKQRFQFPTILSAGQ